MLESQQNRNSRLCTVDFNLHFAAAQRVVDEVVHRCDSGRDQEVVCSQAAGLDAGTVKRSGGEMRL